MDYVKFYGFFKIDFTNESHGEKIGSCPFCGKDSKFSVSEKTGLFRCLSGACDVKGNHLSFMTQYHAHLLNSSLEHHLEEYQVLAKARSLPVETLKNAQLVYREDHGIWYVPYFSGEQVVLGAFNPENRIEKLKYKVFKPSDIPLKLYAPFLPKTQKGKDVWIFEGEWDALAAWSAFRSAKAHPPMIYGLPGATIWKPEWNKQLEGCHVTFFFDNDEAGLKGIESIGKKGKGFHASFASWNTPGVIELNQLNQAAGKPELNDVRDIWKSVKTKSTVLQLLQEMASNADVPEAKNTPSNSINKDFSTDADSIPPLESHAKLHSIMKQCMYTNKSILQTLDIMLASAISVLIPKEPLWIFVVGPASSGKSFLIEAFGGNSVFFEYVSKFTAETLISGSRVTGEDCSMLPTLDGRTLFIKDLTVLLGLPKEIQTKIWDLLRDAYDGYIKYQYGNGEVRTYSDYKFNMIAGVTEAIHRHNDSEMGARWLKVDYLGEHFDEDAHMDMAASNSRNKKDNKKRMIEAVVGYYKHLHTNFNIDKVPIIDKVNNVEIYQKLKSLAKLTAKLETTIAKDRFEGMIYRPVSAVASRKLIQFQVLTEALCVVHQVEAPTNEQYLITKKVAFDSCPELNLEVIEFIFQKGSVTRQDVIRDLNIPSTRVHQIMNDFTQLGIIIQTNIKGSIGRPSFTYSLSEEVSACLEDVKTKKPKKKVVKK